jgi:hypothetical protein
VGSFGVESDCAIIFGNLDFVRGIDCHEEGFRYSHYRCCWAVAYAAGRLRAEKCLAVSVSITDVKNRSGRAAFV